MSDVEIRKLTDSYAVSAQIDAAMIKAIADAGYKAIICNRPDSEVTDDISSKALAKVAKDAGLSYTTVPFGSMGLGREVIEAHTAAMEAADGPVLAYCRSGTRSATVWAFAMAGKLSTDEILKATQSVGYDLDALRAQLDSLAGIDQD